jgi:hypothetical protein
MISLYFLDSTNPKHNHRTGDHSSSDSVSLSLISGCSSHDSFCRPKVYKTPRVARYQDPWLILRKGCYLPISLIII